MSNPLATVRKKTSPLTLRNLRQKQAPGGAAPAGAAPATNTFQTCGIHFFEIPEVVFGLLSKLLALVPTDVVLLVLVTALLDEGFPPAIAAKRSSLLLT